MLYALLATLARLTMSIQRRWGRDLMVALPAGTEHVRGDWAWAKTGRRQTQAPADSPAATTSLHHLVGRREYKRASPAAQVQA